MNETQTADLLHGAQDLSQTKMKRAALTRSNPLHKTTMKIANNCSELRKFLSTRLHLVPDESLGNLINVEFWKELKRAEQEELRKALSPCPEVAARLAPVTQIESAADDPKPWNYQWWTDRYSWPWVRCPESAANCRQTKVAKN